jgi:hypothetical protein
LTQPVLAADLLPTVKMIDSLLAEWLMKQAEACSCVSREPSIP